MAGNREAQCLCNESSQAGPMDSRISTRQKLISQLESTDALLRVILNTITKRHTPINLEPLVEVLLEKDQELKTTLTEVEKQANILKQIDVLRTDCLKSDRQINSCQANLKKAEAVLLDAMVTAVNNPVDVEEVIKLSHHISATHGVCAPDNWMQGDPRRPYPNKDEIRRGYLGHLDDDGNFQNSLWDVLSETAAAASAMANTSQSSNATTGGMSNSSSHSAVQLPGPVSAAAVHGSEMLAMSASPTMVLPGVNMVSSPMTATSQGNTNAWQTSVPTATATANLAYTGADASASNTGLTRPHATSLATMLTAGCANTGLMDSRLANAPPPGAAVGSLVPPPSLPNIRLTTSNTGQQQVPVGTSGGNRSSAGSAMPGVGHKQPSSRTAYLANTPTPGGQSTKGYHAQIQQPHQHQPHQHFPPHHQGPAPIHHVMSASELSGMGTGRRRSKGQKRQLSVHGDTETLSSVSSSESSTGDL